MHDKPDSGGKAENSHNHLHRSGGGMLRAFSAHGKHRFLSLVECDAEMQKNTAMRLGEASCVSGFPVNIIIPLGYIGIYCIRLGGPGQ